MAESFAGYDSIAVLNTDQLRETLRRTMVLGLPDSDTEKPTFYFERVVDFARHDQEGKPWDWTTAPLSEMQAAAVQPICAYEFFSPLGRQGGYSTEVGEFNPTTMIITMFEDEFTEVSGFSYVTVGPGDRRWYFRYWRPAYSINDMTVYQIHCVSEGTA